MGIKKISNRELIKQFITLPMTSKHRYPKNCVLKMLGFKTFHYQKITYLQTICVSKIHQPTQMGSGAIAISLVLGGKNSLERKTQKIQHL